MNISSNLLESLPKQTLPQLQTLIKMVYLGASPKMVYTYLGMTQKEYDTLESSHPELFKAIWAKKTDSALEILSNLHSIARSAQDATAIAAAKIILGNLSDEYKDKPAIAAGSITQNNIHLTLPSTKEALAYIQADPSIIDGDSINE